MHGDAAAQGSKPGGRKSFGAVIALALFGIMFIYLAGGQLWHLAYVKTLKLEFLTSGVIKQTVDVNCIILKNELPVASPFAGRLVLAVKDGEKVRAGTQVAVIETGDAGSGRVGLKAPSGGLFCTHVDGLEELLKPGLLDVLDIEAVEKIEDREKSALAVTGGQSVFKIIDNLMPLGIYVKVTEEVPEDKLAQGKNVTLLWEGVEIKGRVEWLRETGGKKAALLFVENYPDAILHKRNALVKLATGSNSGFVVPSGAVVEENGQKGIYASQKQRAVWLEVEVLSSLSGRSVIKGKGLNEGTRYVTNPRWVRTGDYLE